jgi:hypothetical protein
MAEHGLVVTDLIGTTRAFLEAYGLKLTRAINGAAKLEFSAATDDPKARELLIGKRAVKLYRDGVLRFYGVLGEPFIDGPDAVSCVAYDPFFFLKAAHVGSPSLAPWTYTGWDAGAIAWELVNGLGYETHLRQGNVAASVNRDRTYEAGKSIAEAITQLAEVEGGFYFRVDPVDGEGATFGTFNVLYPDAGVTRERVRFEYGDGTLGNISGEGLEVERFMPVNAVNEGDPVPVAVAEDSASESEYGTCPEWLTLSDVVNTATLQEHADEELSPEPPVALRFNAVEGGPVLWDDFDIGDTVYVRVDNGRTLVTGPVRVNQVTVEVDDDTGAERLTGLVLESPNAVAQEVR